MDSYLSAAFGLRDRATVRLQTHMARQGVRWSITPRVACECADPGCRVRDPERFSIALLLDAFTAYWDPATAEHRRRDPEESDAAALASAVREWADSFGLGVPGELGPAETVGRARDAWRARMGIPADVVTTGALAGLDLVEARNGELLLAFAERLAALSFRALATAAVRETEREHRAWGYESAQALHQAATRWLPDLDTLAEVSGARRVALEIVRESGWDADLAQVFAGAVAHAILAVMTYGIVHESFTEAAYEPLEPLVPFDALRMELLLGQRTGSARVDEIP